MNYLFGLPARRRFAAFAFALGTAFAASAAEPNFRPLYENTPQALVVARTLHSEGKGVFLENIVALPDGSYVVTSVFDGRILRIARDGKTRPIATVPGHAAGIERDGSGNLIVGGWDKNERRVLWRVSLLGKVEEAVHLTQAVMPNGITTLTPGVLLVADSVKGVIWRVDLRTRRLTVWTSDPLLGGFDPETKPAIPAVNGLKVHRGQLYASNMSLNHLVRITIRADGTAGAAEIYAKDVFADDFVIDSRGHIYATTHAYNSVIHIEPDRSVSVIAGREQGLQVATALAFLSELKGKRGLIVVTNGGVYVPPAWGVEDAKIVHLELPAVR